MRERENEQEALGGGENPQAGSPVSLEPNAGLDLTTGPELKPRVGHLTKGTTRHTIRLRFFYLFVLIIHMGSPLHILRDFTLPT